MPRHVRKSAQRSKPAKQMHMHKEMQEAQNAVREEKADLTQRNAAIHLHTDVPTLGDNDAAQEKGEDTDFTRGKGTYSSGNRKAPVTRMAESTEGAHTAQVERPHPASHSQASETVPLPFMPLVEVSPEEIQQQLCRWTEFQLQLMRNYWNFMLMPLRGFALMEKQEK